MYVEVNISVGAIEIGLGNKVEDVFLNVYLCHFSCLTSCICTGKTERREFCFSLGAKFQ